MYRKSPQFRSIVSIDSIPHLACEKGLARWQPSWLDVHSYSSSFVQHKFSEGIVTLVVIV